MPTRKLTHTSPESESTEIEVEEIDPSRISVRKEGPVDSTPTTGRADELYRVLLERDSGVVPIGYVGVVRKLGGTTSMVEFPSCLSAGVNWADRVAHINEFYPLIQVQGQGNIYERAKRRGIGKKVMTYLLDDLSAKGFRWAYVFPSGKREIVPLLEKFDFQPADAAGLFYFRQL